MQLLHLAALTLLATLSVSLWTVRVVLTAGGRRGAAAVAASVEAVVFALAFSRALASLDSPTRLLAYGIGVGGGTLLGLGIEDRLAVRRSPGRSRWLLSER